MKKQHTIASIVSLIVISGAILLSACASIASAKPKSGLEAQVGTAVAATLVQQMIETDVAAQSVAMVSQPVAQAATATQPPAPTATSTPVPSPTAVPTDVPTVQAPPPTPTLVPSQQPAPQSSGTKPTISADADTNCRTGPGTGYTVVTYFLEGQQSTVEGRDATKDWWYIVNPKTSSGYCWVWNGSTTVVGDASQVPVVAAPAAPDYHPSDVYEGYYYCNPYAAGYYGYYGCGYSYNYNYYANYYKCNPYKNCTPYKYYPNKCNPNKACYYPYTNCTCKPVKYNPCKKSGCPPITSVNINTYCNKYPSCCD
jgi:uncharacterized protein YgiM (DUF1202 family)